MYETSECMHVVHENVNDALLYFAITDVSPACSAFPSTISTSERLSQMWHHPIWLPTDEIWRTRKLKALTFEIYNSMCKYMTNLQT